MLEGAHHTHVGKRHHGCGARLGLCACLESRGGLKMVRLKQIDLTLLSLNSLIGGSLSEQMVICVRALYALKG